MHHIVLNNIKLLFVEIPTTATNLIRISTGRNKFIEYHDGKYVEKVKVFETNKVIDYSIVGTTATLTNEQVEPFVRKGLNQHDWLYENSYNGIPELETALEGWVTAVDARDISLTKNWCVIMYQEKNT
jgi:hypothetical protein